MLNILASTQFFLPLLIASVSAFVAFESLAQMRHHQRQYSRIWLSAVSFGLGIWFTGHSSIQNLRLSFHRFYDMRLLAIAIVGTVLTAWLVLHISSGRARTAWPGGIGTALLLSFEINAADILNLTALHITPRLHWQVTWLLCSVAIGTVGTYAALRLLVPLDAQAGAVLPKVTGSLLLGITIYALHCCAVKAALFAADAYSPEGPLSVRGAVLGRLGLSIVVLFAVGLLILSYEQSSQWIRVAHRAQQAAQESVQKMERLATASKIAASLAHEVNNPLEAIGNLLYLAELGQLDSDSRGYLAQAQTELRRVAEITTHSLRFYRQQSAPEVVHISDLFETALALFNPRLERAQIHVDRFWQADVPPIECRSGEIRQVLANLVSNAIDAMPEGGTLALSLKRLDDTLEIGVADTGSGISAELKKRIFEPFFTTKGLRGTGLGLAISAEIIARHGGHIDLTSSTDVGHTGTRFSVTLPYTPHLPASGIGLPQISGSTDERLIAS